MGCRWATISGSYRTKLSESGIPGWRTPCGIGTLPGMAITSTQSIEIQASPAELFAIITDLEAYPDWLEGMETVEILEEDAEGFPHRATMTVDVKLRTVTYVLAYEYDYPTEVRWTSEPGGDVKHIDGSYALEELDDGMTRVTYELTLDPGFPVPGFMLKQAQKSIMTQALRGLKAQADA